MTTGIRPRRLVPAAVLVLAIACSGGDTGAGQGDPRTAADSAKQAVGGLVGGLLKMAAKQDSLDKTNPYANLSDPCILVSRAEVEKYLGPLAADPYRVQTLNPSPDGDACMYMGATGRSITISPSYTGGKAVLKMTGAVMGTTNQVIVTNSGAADTLEGEWDDAKWVFGALEALKGDVLVSVDVNGSDAGPADAAALADIALRRLDHPLAYDGAAAKAPPPLVAPRDPCSLVTKEEAAAIVGPVDGTPTAGEAGCTYTIPSPLGHGTVPLEIKVVWRHGFRSMNSDLGVGRAVHEGFTRKTLEGAGVATKDAQASDTLKGPWDQAAFMPMRTFTAVKKDVLVSVDIGLVGSAKAKALVTTAMSKL